MSILGNMDFEVILRLKEPEFDGGVRRDCSDEVLFPTLKLGKGFSTVA
jgi:hypothetical protein